MSKDHVTPHSVFPAGLTLEGIETAYQQAQGGSVRNNTTAIIVCPTCRESSYISDNGYALCEHLLAKAKNHLHKEDDGNLSVRECKSLIQDWNWMNPDSPRYPNRASSPTLSHYLSTNNTTMMQVARLIIRYHGDPSLWDVSEDQVRILEQQLPGHFLIAASILEAASNK
jgi:hypothetical protein